MLLANFFHDQSQAKKDADVKRLQDLFNNSPSEDGDSPEDDMGDKRELLP